MMIFGLKEQLWNKNNYNPEHIWTLTSSVVISFSQTTEQSQTGVLLEEMLMVS